MAINQPADCDNRENGVDHLTGYLWLVVVNSVRSSADVEYTMTDNPNVPVGGGRSGENCGTDDDRYKYGPDDDRSVPTHGWKIRGGG